MKITYFHYLYRAEGGAQHVRQFTEAAERLGHRVSVHAMNLAPSDDRPGVRCSVRKCLKTRYSRYLHEPKELLWNLLYIRRELAIVRAEHPDVILARSHHLTFAEAAVRSLARVPLVLEVNAPAAESDTYFHEYLHLSGAGLLTERIKLRAADSVLAVSDALRRHLLAAHRVAPEKFLVNHNGADCTRFSRAASGAAVRHRYALGSDLVIGFVGHFKPWHGTQLLRRLIEALCRPGVKFLLVGSGSEYDRLHDWLAHGPYAQQIVMPGPAPHCEVPEHVAAMDVALVPDSNFYGSSLKLLEYMAAGRAVVAPRYGPIAEVADHGRHALLFSPGNLPDAVQCVDTLLADPDLRQRLGDNARRRVTEQFTWSRNAERVLDACQRALSRWHTSTHAGAGIAENLQAQHLSID
jgi:glycosyltransferase involved in cell wall biosynthesis